MAIPTEDLRGWLQLAEETARQAGEYLARARRAEMVVESDSARDLKLEVDRRSEERILSMLRQKSDFAILSEECGSVEGRSGDQGMRWIVDPLDGTVNYFRGVPFSCVSIGLWNREEPLLGVVYDFGRGEMFTGIVGVGAWLNGARVFVSEVEEPKQAVLCTGFPLGTDFSPCSVSTFVEQLVHYKKVRLLGSAGLSLAYVAAGRTDAYYERDIKLWDVAGGLALVYGAGGSVVRAASQRPQALTVYAGNSALPRPSL